MSPITPAWRKLRRGACGGGALLALITAPAAAQDREHGQDRALSGFQTCRPIADAAARAGCYDAALDRLQRAIGAHQVVIMDREQTEEQRRSLFGFGPANPRPPTAYPTKAARAAAQAEELNRIDSTVASVTPYSYDQWIIRLANGAVWRTTEAGITLPPRPGQAVHIARGMMGGFMLRLDQGRPVRAMRVG